jgi:hypothetical protein
MKNIIFAFGLLLISTALISQESYTEFIINDDKVVVNFNSKMEFMDLANLKSELERAGIMLEFTELKFNDENKLQNIGFRVESEILGVYGSANRNSLTKNDSFGFEIYSGKGDVNFGTGQVQKVSK